jgi:hypothetical protein
MGKDAGIGIAPGLDIDARKVCGICRPRQPNAQREFVHTPSIIQPCPSRKRHFTRKILFLEIAIHRRFIGRVICAYSFLNTGVMARLARAIQGS